MQSLPADELACRFKVCSDCKVNKPWSEYTIRRDRGRPQSRCKPCAVKHHLARYEYHPRKLPAEKACTNCGIVQAYDKFPIKSRKSGRTRSVCQDCKNRKKAEYRATNLEKVRAGDATYREARKAELTERQRLWREAHPERYSEIHAKWKRENRDACKAMAHRRRLKIKGAGDSFKDYEWQALKQACDNRCLMCGRQEPDVFLTQDHIISPQLGGTNTIENLQPLCGAPWLALNSTTSCNSSKSQSIVDYRPLHIRLMFGFSTQSDFTAEEGKRHSAAIDRNRGLVTQEEIAENG